MVCIDPPTKPAVRRLARRLTEGGTATLAEWALVCGADNAGRGTGSRPNPATAWLDMGRTLSVQDRPAKGILTGHHLIARGMQPGPMFKPILADALAAQDAGEFTDEAGALAWLRTWP
jgi:tRNA nucleotidyltransferase (CCA-adding enzyme)